MSSGAYQTAKSIQRLQSGLGSNRVRKARKVKEKLTWRHRLRNWLNKDLEDIDRADIPVQEIETARLSSEGMRFQLYRASGGYVIETRTYDHRNDRNDIKMYVITEDQDVGQEIGKIITMESLR